MERDTSQTPELRSSSSEEDEDDEETSKKGKKPAAVVLGKLWERALPKASESKEEPVEDKDKTPPTERKESEEHEQSPDIAEDDAPLETLSESEARAVAARTVTEREGEVSTEQAKLEADTPEAKAAAAAAQFLEAADLRLHAEDAPTAAEALEQARQETLRVLAFGSVPEAAPADVVFDEQPPSDSGMEYEEPDNADNGAARPAGPGRPPAGYDFAPGDMPPIWTGSPDVAGNRATAPEDDDEGNEARAALSGFLLGGLVGYLVGRRRGRIKTEARLKPIQQKLEAEVKAIYGTVVEKENQIRQLVLERERSRFQERAAALAASGHTQESMLRSNVNPQERLGLMSLKAAESRSKEAVRPPSANVEQMSLQQVLELSEGIVVGATTVRRIHETNLISERGLRRVVAEFLRGGNHLPILAAEMAAKERDHELDPRLRDRPPELAGAKTVSSAQAVPLAGDMVNMGVGAVPLGGRRPIAIPVPGAGQQPVRQILVAANVFALVVLAILVAVLGVIWLLR